jgi:hypothetical protein
VSRHCPTLVARRRTIPARTQAMNYDQYIS